MSAAPRSLGSLLGTTGRFAGAGASGSVLHCGAGSGLGVFKLFARHRARAGPPGQAFRAVPLTPVPGWRRHLGGGQRFPVEGQPRILGLEDPPRLGIERLSSDFDTWRCTEPVQHARWSAAAAGRNVHEIDVLIASPVAGEPYERHDSACYLRFCERMALRRPSALAVRFWRVDPAARGLARAADGLATRRGATAPASRVRWTIVKRTSSPTE